jgi:hypothetical protein
MGSLISFQPSGRHQPSRRSRAVARHAARLKSFVADGLKLSDDCTVSVNEVRCAEPGCPDLETVIVIWRPGQEPLRLRCLKPVAAVTEEDIALLL